MELRTPRLNLRLLESRDWAFFQQLNQNHIVMRYVAEVPDEQSLKTLFTSRIATWEKGQDNWLTFIIERRDNNEPIGLHGLKSSAQNPQHAELGFMLHPDFQGQGFALEATQAVVDFANKTQNYSSLIATVTEGNNASLSLLKKLGFTHLNTLQKNYQIYETWYDDIILVLEAE